MKKLNLLLLAIIAIAFTFTACNPEPTDHFGPSVTIDQADQTVDAGSSIAFTGVVTSTGEITEVRFFVGGTQFGETVTTFSDNTSYTFRVDVDSIDADFEFKVQATDELDQMSYKSVNITVNTTPTMSEYTGKNMSYTSTTLADNCMFNAVTGTVLMANGTAADMDFAFCWQTTYGYSIVSPDATWIQDLWGVNSVTYVTSDKSNTKFATYTAKAYADITAGDLNSIAISSSATVTGGGNGYQYLSSGDLIAFITADGYKGVIEFTNPAKITKTCTVNAKVVAPSTVK